MSQRNTLRITFAVLCLAGVGPAQAFAQSSVSLGVYGHAEDYIYGGKLGSDDRTWNDLIVSTGLSLQLGGR